MKALIVNAEIVNNGEQYRGWLLTDDKVIAGVGHGAAPDDCYPDRVIDAHGALLLPGAIDTHVHFREPGLTHKATIASESASAVAGGVTSYLEMPNTVPPTVTTRAVADKLEIARRDSLANYAFFIGATNDNINQLLAADYSTIPGVKLFMGSSTGNMLVDDTNAITRLFSRFKGVIAVHAEDEQTIAAARTRLIEQYGDDVPVSEHHRLRPAEACYRASERAVNLARATGARVHLLHISTAAELGLLNTHYNSKKQITAETCPHYLLWTQSDLSQPDGHLKKCNPAIKSETDRRALIKALAEGIIDTVATDHAPHRREDKEGTLFEAASGMPGIKFMLTTMLDMTIDPANGLTVPMIVAKCCHAPADIYGIDRRGYLTEGYYADLTLVERCAPHTISHSDAVTNGPNGRPVTGGPDWTPYAGSTTQHRVVMTMVNGEVVYQRGSLSGKHSAMPLKFNHDE